MRSVHSGFHWVLVPTLPACSCTRRPIKPNRVVGIHLCGQNISPNHPATPWNALLRPWRVAAVTASGAVRNQSTRRLAVAGNRAFPLPPPLPATRSGRPWTHRAGTHRTWTDGTHPDRSGDSADAHRAGRPDHRVRRVHVDRRVDRHAADGVDVPVHPVGARRWWWWRRLCAADCG